MVKTKKPLVVGIEVLKKNGIDINKLIKELVSNASVEFTGFVDDLSAHLSEAQCTVIPVFGGNGVRIKTVSLLGAGLPAVSTPDGVEGLPVEHYKDAIIANTPESFSSGLRSLLSIEQRRQLAENCRTTMNGFLSEENDATTLHSISEKIA